MFKRDRQKKIQITWKAAYWTICQNVNILPKKAFFGEKLFYKYLYSQILMEVCIYTSLTTLTLISMPFLFNRKDISWYFPISFVPIISLKLLSVRYCNVLGFLEKASVWAPLFYKQLSMILSYF